MCVFSIGMDFLLCNVNFPDVQQFSLDSNYRAAPTRSVSTADCLTAEFG